MEVNTELRPRAFLLSRARTAPVFSHEPGLRSSVQVTGPNNGAQSTAGQSSQPAQWANPLKAARGRVFKTTADTLPVGVHWFLTR